MSDWFSRKLLGPSAPPASVAPRLPANPATAQAPPGWVYVGEDTDDKHLEYAKKHAVHARQGTNECPACGFEEYWTVGRVAGIELKRCFDCGYPVEQQGSNITAPAGGKATPAKQVPHAGLGGASNYQPKTVIDRIG